MAVPSQVLRTEVSQAYCGVPRTLPRAMVFASLLGFALIAAGCVNWPMFRHDPGHSGDNQFSTSTVSGVLKWKMLFPKGCMVVSRPTVDGSEKIYIGAVCGTGQSQTGGFCAINPNGTSAWCNTHMQGWPQYSSAAIEAAVYIGGIDSGKAGLIAIDPNSGNLLWTLPAPVIYSPPTFSLGLSSVTGQVETTTYIGAIDGNLYAVDPSGTKKWDFTLEGIISSSPAVAQDGTIYVGFSNPAVIGTSPTGGLGAVNPNGTKKWIFGPIGGVDSSPAIGGDGTIYFGSYDQFFYAVKPDGSQKWALADVGQVVSSPGFAPGGRVIYFGSRDHRLWAIDQNALLKWVFTTGGNIDSSPAISSDGTVFVGSSDHYLYAINPNGKLKWRFLTGGPVRSSPAIGEFGRTIYMGSDDGNLYAIQ